MAKRARDADEVKRRKMARSRFRNLIRSVALNRIWLMDSTDQKLSLNVKKNIALLVRTQRKIGLLTLAEKSLIRTHHSLRTTEEKKKLVSLMAGLNCFTNIPPKVRARLSKCVKFMIVTPGRKLIKEGDPPAMLYFLLTGEVEVSKSVFDHIQNCWVNRIEKLCGPGDCLGDVELIERTKRRHTYTTTNMVELLVVFEDDFEQLLRPVMEQQWTEKKTAIKALDYFKFLTNDQITNACKLCVMRQFEPLETIYYEDKGQLSYVHFVVSGECMILQCLKMKVSQKGGGNTFELIDISKEDAGLLFQNMSKTQLLRIMRDQTHTVSKHTYNVDEIIASDETESYDQSVKGLDQLNIRNLEIKCGLVEPSESFTEESLSNELSLSEATGSIGSASSKSDNMTERKESQLKSDNETNNKTSSHQVSNMKHLSAPSSHKSERSMLQGSSYSAHKKPTGKIENHFIDVGSLTFGAIFGLGEKLENRVIMARTAVQCLMIPRFWIFEKDQNPGNIWQRRRFYLDTTIPSRQTLFRDFLYTRQWQKFKTNLIQTTLDPNSIANPTRVQDIPIICRIVEARDE